MTKRYLLCFSVLLLLLFLGFMIGCGGDGTSGINYQNVTVVPGILTPTPAGSNFGTVSGKVTDPLNNPLSNATVKVENLTLTATTNDKGEYTIWNVPVGKQKCIASKEDFIETYNCGDVIPGQIVTINIVLPPNSWNDPAVIEQMDNLEAQANQYLEEQKQTQGNDHQARESTIAWLKQQPLINDASFSPDEITIWYKTNLGIVRYIPPEPIISELITKGGKNKDYIESLSVITPDIPQNTLTSSSIGKALILLPCRYEGEYFDNTVLKVMLENWGYDVDYRENRDKNNPDITEETWRTILDDGYDVIVISTHGCVNEDGQVILSTGIGSWISPQFIYNNYAVGAFNSTKVVYCGACEGLFNETMSDAFLSKGANIYYGWTKPVAGIYSIKTSVDLIGDMVSGGTADESYNYIKNLYPGHDGTIDPFKSKDGTKFEAQLKYDDNYSGLGGIKLRDYSPSTPPSSNYQDYQCAWISQSNYPTTNSYGYLWVNFKNTGKATWYRSGDYPVNLGTSNPIDRNSTIEYRWFTYNRPASLLQRYVNPEDIGTFIFFFAPDDYQVKEYFRPVVENVTWMDDWGVFWLIEFAYGYDNSYLHYTGAIPPLSIIEGNLPIGDGNVDVTVDKKGGK